MMLAELDPKWLGNAHVRFPANSFASRKGPFGPDVQGIIFLCPTCFRANNGPIGTHSVMIWFRDKEVNPVRFPLPRWKVESGTSFDDLTLSPSINVQNEHWHGFILHGEIK